jgi:hypothetical protein
MKTTPLGEKHEAKVPETRHAPVAVFRLASAYATVLAAAGAELVTDAPRRRLATEEPRGTPDFPAGEAKMSSVVSILQRQSAVAVRI